MEVRDNLLTILALLWIVQAITTLIIGFGLVIAGIFIIFEGNFIPLITGGIAVAIAIVELLIMLVMVE